MSQGSTSLTVVVHGLWYGKLSIGLLARRLEQQGLATRRFAYPTIRRSLAENARGLADFGLQFDADEIHWVGHSLGGLVILRMLDEFDERLPDGRVVLLGSPVHGSAVARSLTRVALTRPLSRTFLGRAANGLKYGFAHAPAHHQTGIIAGTSPVGAGQLVSRLERPHDGTVAVSETELDGAADRLLVSTSHTGLLASSTVARATVEFIRTGQFS